VTRKLWAIDQEEAVVAMRMHYERRCDFFHGFNWARRKTGTPAKKLGLTEDEVAFYDALEVNDSAVKVLGDECLRAIAHEFLETIRANVTIDWTAKESVRAKLRVMVNCYCGNTVIRPTSRKRHRRPCLSRQS
jgi:hypothetical protein